MTQTIVSSQYPEIPGYKVVRPLGKGGMAVVYVATQDAYLNREIALKILPMELAGDQSYVQRFLLEAESIGKLEHPNITAVYEFGEHEGQLFLAMRLLHGGGLDQRMEKTEIAAEEAIEITRCIAKALGFAHNNGIVHRDVKPENILFDGEGNPMLADFGIAREVTGDGALTQGFVIGTVPYMSPEQMSGEPVDGTTDLYSLGVLLYELLTHEKLYHGKPFADVLLAKIGKERPQLPGSLRRFQPLINRLLAPEPTDRYPDAASFVTQLDAIASASTASTRGRWKTIAALGGLCIAAAALGYTAYSGNFDATDQPATDQVSVTKDISPPARLPIANTTVPQFHSYLDIVDEKNPEAAAAFINANPPSSLTVIAKLVTESTTDARARINALLDKAKTGDKGAALVLSEAYNEGWGIDQDREQARRWASEAAASGETFARYALALIELEDDADPANGLARLTRLADEGFFPAEGLLGSLLLQGTVGEPEPVRGIALLQRAANKNYRAALFNLAAAYASGTGVAQNSARARELLQRAAQLGDRDALEAIAANSP